MPVSGHVQRDMSRKIEDYEVSPDRTMYVIGSTRNRFAVYADDHGYTSTSGQTLDRGKAELDAEGKVVTFRTAALAKAWVRAGLPVVDERGDLLDWKQYEAELEKASSKESGDVLGGRLRDAVNSVDVPPVNVSAIRDKMDRG